MCIIVLCLYFFFSLLGRLPLLHPRLLRKDSGPDLLSEYEVRKADLCKSSSLRTSQQTLCWAIAPFFIWALRERELWHGDPGSLPEAAGQRQLLWWTLPDVCQFRVRLWGCQVLRLDLLWAGRQLLHVLGVSIVKVSAEGFQFSTVTQIARPTLVFGLTQNRWVNGTVPIPSGSWGTLWLAHSIHHARGLFLEITYRMISLSLSSAFIQSTNIYWPRTIHQTLY